MENNQFLTLSQTKSNKKKNEFTQKIIFNNINWIYLISALLLLSLPIINFPFTSRYGYDYQFRFFLDSTLLSNLDPTRNLLHYLFPLPIYTVTGVIPGVVGFIIIFYVILNAFPKILHFNSSKFRISEFKFGIPIKHEFDNNSLQMINIGNRRMSTISWLGFSALLYLASVIWNYGFDSVLNNGSWFYFTIEQWVWDGTEVIFTINLGFHLFITVLILIIAGLLIVIFPRKNLTIETSEYQIKFPYYSFYLKSNEVNDSKEHSSILCAFKTFLNESNHRNPNKEIITEKEELNCNKSIENLIKTQSPTFIPRLKLILLTVSIVSLLLTIFLPGFFFGDFYFPFGMVGFITLLFLMLRSLFYEVYSKQKLLTPNQDFMILRYNLISKLQLFYINNPINVSFEKKYTKNRHFLYLFGTLMIWEILVVITNMVQFITYFLTNPWTFLHLILIILYIFTLIYVLFDKSTNAEITPEKQTLLHGKDGELLKETLNIPFNLQISTIKEELRNWHTTLKRSFVSRETKKENITPLTFFIIPVIVFLVWLILYIINRYRFFVYFLI